MIYTMQDTLINKLTQLQVPEVSQSDKARAEQLKAEGKLEHNTITYTADVDSTKKPGDVS